MILVIVAAGKLATFQGLLALHNKVWSEVKKIQGGAPCTTLP